MVGLEEERRIFRREMEICNEKWEGGGLYRGRGGGGGG